MKRKANNSWNILLVLFFVGIGFFTPLFCQQPIPLLYNFKEELLTARLGLDGEQIESVKKLANMLQAQATQDRQNFKGNVPALLAAAERRAIMADNLLNTLLDNNQKLRLKTIKEEQVSYREVFVLKEVLILDETQTAKVQIIIENYTLQPDEINNRLSQYQDSLSGSDDLAGSDMNRQGMDSMDGRRQRPDRGMRPAGGGIVELFKEQERKKQKAIDAILTPEQKTAYTQLKEILGKEFDKRMEKLKEGNRN